MRTNISTSQIIKTVFLHLNQMHFWAESVHHKVFFVQIQPLFRLVAYHVELYWSEYDTLGRVGRGPLILMVFPQIVLLQCDPEDSFTDCTMYNTILRILLWILLPRCCTHNWQNLTLHWVKHLIAHRVDDDPLCNCTIYVGHSAKFVCPNNRNAQ